jgi:hypothetical protein
MEAQNIIKSDQVEKRRWLGKLGKLDLMFVPSSFVRFMKEDSKGYSNVDKTIGYGVAIVGEIARIAVYSGLASVIYHFSKRMF